MSSGTRFNFARGNLRKVFALPAYACSALLALFVPRTASAWVFGSGIGFGEGAREVALTLRADDPAARITWIAGSDEELESAKQDGFDSVLRGSMRGWWRTLRAGFIVITHGLGDANRFGIFGGRVINLIHGAPLKKLHFDSAVTTHVSAPPIVRALLRRMYAIGAKQIALYVAGSVTSAERLRTAYRVQPGLVQVLGDPRDDQLCLQARDPQLAAAARRHVRDLLGLPAEPTARAESLVLYAPTWRDGDPDPAAPSPREVTQIVEALERSGARLLIRSHPLGHGAYEPLLGDRVHLLGKDQVRDITPMLGAFDAIITDYSSIALDFSLLGRPIVWFAPDLEHYTASRGLYEPLEVTAAGQVQRTWTETLSRLGEVLEPGSLQQREARSRARQLASRFHAHPEGGAAKRVVEAAKRLRLRDHERIAADAVFFESFYGKQVSCNPLALDREIAAQLPSVPRYWSVTSERISVPNGATPLLVGSPDWHAARRRARLLIINDWLRLGFRRSRHQTVLQTWHGTMLKHLALGRPNVNLRTRIAVRRESRRWSLLLSQNPHSSEQFRHSYAFRGKILETGYPRDDRLAAALAANERMTVIAQAAKRALSIPVTKKVLAYVPTWRDGSGGSSTVVDLLDVHALSAELGDDWVVVARGHTRSAGAYLGSDPRVIDATQHPDVNDVLLAADLLVTDYSSVMFDAAVARVPMLFFVPDLASYRDRERGFTFDFEQTAPGPLVTTRAEVVSAAHNGVAIGPEYEAWCERFVPHDDGHAARRVVAALVERGALVG